MQPPQRAPFEASPDGSGSSGLGPGCLSAERALRYIREGRASEATGSGRSGEAQRIQSHLDDCSRCRTVLAEAVRSASDAGEAGTPLRTLRDGQRLLDRYEIRRFIARGGMGEVYEAHDDVLGERVALKTLLPTALDDARAVERMRAEVRLARRVSHPNVCRIFEFGVYHPEGPGSAALPFLTMEFLTGEPLSARIAAQGPLAPATVATLLERMTAGLAAIHAAGIVHRDFKGANVFLVRAAGGEERPMVMDFGLARPHDGASSTGSVGTPDYMAPEQVEGKPATPAFDIYALGVVAFEMLTGRKPFESPSPYMAALGRLQRPAPAPSALRPELAPAWDQVVGRCLEREPGRRFARVEEVASALAAALGQPVPPPRGRRVAVALAGLALAAVAALAVVQRGRGSGARPVAPGPPRTAAVAPPVPPPPAPAASPPALAAVPPAKAPPARPAPLRPHRRERAAPEDPAPAPKGPAPAPPPSSLERAQALLLAGDRSGACLLGEEALAAAPDDPAAHSFLGKCYIRLGDAGRARQHYRRYLLLAPDAPDAVFVRAILAGQR